jgi:phage pi2 protein 07
MFELTMEYVSIVLSVILLVLLSSFLLRKHRENFYTIRSLPQLIKSFYVDEKKHWAVFLLLVFMPFFDRLWVVVVYSVGALALIVWFHPQAKKNPIQWDAKTLRVSSILLIIATIFGSAVAYWTTPKELVPVIILTMFALAILFAISVLIVWPFESIDQTIRLLIVKRKLQKHGIVSVIVFRSNTEPSMQHFLSEKTLLEEKIFYTKKLVESVEEFLLEFFEMFEKDCRMVMMDFDYRRWKYARWIRSILRPTFVVYSESNLIEWNTKTIEDMFKKEKTVYFKNIVDFPTQDKRFGVSEKGWKFIPETKGETTSPQAIHLEKEATFYDWVIREILSQTRDK